MFWRRVLSSKKAVEKLHRCSQTLRHLWHFIYIGYERWSLSVFFKVCFLFTLVVMLIYEEHKIFISILDRNEKMAKLINNICFEARELIFLYFVRMIWWKIFVVVENSWFWFTTSQQKQEIIQYLGFFVGRF